MKSKIRTIARPMNSPNVRQIMKRGEGLAIVNAGTARIPKTLKSSSRRIKNSL